jgi:hypothetical protein
VEEDAAGIGPSDKLDAIQLEEWVIDIGETEDANVDHGLLVVLLLGPEGLEAVDGGTALGHNVCEDLDVDIGALDDVVIRDEVGEPSIDLFCTENMSASDGSGCLLE